MVDELVTVNRGKFGAFERISKWDLVVGDIIMVGPGERVGGDCLVVESSDFKVDEKCDEKVRARNDAMNVYYKSRLSKKEDDWL
jgi:hypothetical protein